MKIFLDTNIWLRFFLRDNKQAEDCIEIIRQIELGNLTPYISSIVLIEVNFVLTFTYKHTNKKSYKYLDTILKTRNLTIVEKTNTHKALDIYKKHNIKYTDCLIVTQLPSKTILVTYDKEFKKIPRLNPQTPKQILEKLEGKHKKAN